jgi:KaiC/GvpD/RAD55 family RecA-like ATPase
MLTIESLLKPFIKTIVIKGKPGAGKTTLSFELMRMVGSGLYVSTRTALKELVDQYPYIKPLVEEGAVRGISFEDLRLGSAADVMESVLKATEELKNPVIILDSWDSIARELDPIERLRAEKSLAAMVEPTDSKLVFVSETAETSSLDYLADAIVVLEDREVDGARMRYIVWEKIRGVPIPQKRYIFTLHEGWFRLFQPLIMKRPEPTREFKPLELEGAYSTGSMQLDRLLGRGMPKGSGTLFLLGREVSSYAILPFIAMMISNFVMTGGSAVVMPIAGISMRTMTEATAGQLPEELRSRVKVVDVKKEEIDLTSPEAALRDLRRIIKDAKGEEERNCMIIAGMDFLEYHFPGRDLRAMSLDIMGQVKDTEDTAVFIARPSTKIREELEDLVDCSLELKMIEGALVLRSRKPPSIYYHLDFTGERGIELTPIV